MKKFSDKFFNVHFILIMNAIIIWIITLISEATSIYYYITVILKLTDFDSDNKSPIDTCSFLNKIIKPLLYSILISAICPLIDFLNGYLASLINFLPIICYIFFKLRRKRIFDYYYFVSELDTTKAIFLVLLLLNAITFLLTLLNVVFCIFTIESKNQ